MGFILSYCYYYFHKDLFQWTIWVAQESKLKNGEVTIIFLQWWRGQFAVLNYGKTWVKSKEKEMLIEKNIKGELKCRSLKFTSVSSLCYKYELYPLK